ncbi:NAD(P)/FAD-dependent oxidoreductase [Roseimarinus sediminis]|jgi:glycine/D-amino acid oxidase-like deaminating enzyme|uniref:NAD(P)/FAD-dependent oxidoreductase n=1 Tax=Roseimarinus sediminis TaxID=1610899 RepID=UPI003D21A4DA
MQHDSFDTIIVGFGMAGATLAFHLGQEGLPFLVVDKQQINASKVAAGMFNPMVFRRLLKSWMADELLQYAGVLYPRIEKYLNIQCYHPLDYYKVLGSEEEPFWIKRAGQSDTQPYIDDNCSEKPEIKLIHHPYGAARVRGAGYLDIPQFINNYRLFLTQNDAFLAGDFDYSALSIGNNRLNYKGIDAKRIVFCEGSFMSDNPWFSYLPFKSTKGEVLTIHCPDLNLGAAVNKKIFLLPLGKDLYRVGATYSWDQPDFVPSEGARQQLLDQLDKLLPLPYTVIDHRAGVRPTTNDRRPVLGPHPLHPNLYIFNGLGSKGVMLAPYFARQLFEFIFKEGHLNSEVDIKRYERKYFHTR